MANHGTETNQFMSNLPLTSSHPHPTVGNPGDDQSMSDLHLTSSHTHSTLVVPGDQFMDFDDWYCKYMLNDSGDQFIDFDDFEWRSMLNESVKDADEFPSPWEIRMEGIPSPGLAADAAAVAEIGQPASGLLGENSLVTSAAVANKLPPARMELSDGVCRDQSLFDISTSTARAMHHAGALDDDGIRGPHPAQGLFQPDMGTDMGTVDVRNPCPYSVMLKKSVSTSTARAMHHAGALDDNGIRRPYRAQGLFQSDQGEFRIEYLKQLPSAILDLLVKKEKSYQVDVDSIRNMNIVFNQEKSISNDYQNFLVDPLEPPTSKGSYLTRFMAKLDDDKKDKKADDNTKAGYWKEKEAVVIRDLSASRNIIGIERTLEFMNGRKRTRWLAEEYIALEPLGHDAVRILDDIVVRRVYEEARRVYELANEAKDDTCSKTGAHSSGESYIWQHMTRVYAGSTEAPSLLYGICHKCDRALKCPPNFGSGNLNKHLASVHKIHPPCKKQCVMTEEKGVGRRAVRV